MRKEEKVVFNKFGAVMLHPETVPSHIRHSITVTRYRGGPTFSYEIHLSDCQRTIRWHGYGSQDIDSGIQKVQNAIKALRTIELNLIQALAAFTKHQRKRRKKS